MKTLTVGDEEASLVARHVRYVDPIVHHRGSLADRPSRRSPLVHQFDHRPCI